MKVYFTSEDELYVEEPLKLIMGFEPDEDKDKDKGSQSDEDKGDGEDDLVDSELRKTLEDYDALAAKRLVYDSILDRSDRMAHILRQSEHKEAVLDFLVEQALKIYYLPTNLTPAQYIAMQRIGHMLRVGGRPEPKPGMFSTLLEEQKTLFGYCEEDEMLWASYDYAGI